MGGGPEPCFRPTHPKHMSRATAGEDGRLSFPSQPLMHRVPTEHLISAEEGDAEWAASSSSSAVPTAAQQRWIAPDAETISKLLSSFVQDERRQCLSLLMRAPSAVDSAVEKLVSGRSGDELLPTHLAPPPAFLVRTSSSDDGACGNV